MTVRKSSNSGYSLIEILLSLALLSISILMVAVQQTLQMQSEGGAGLQMAARQLLQETAAELVANHASFPNVTSPDGVPLVYVGCYLDDRTEVDRVGPPGSAGRGYVGVVPPDTFQLRARFTDANGGGEICPVDQGGFEVHITRNAADPREMNVIVIVLPFALGRPAESSATVFETTVGVDL